MRILTQALAATVIAGLLATPAGAQPAASPPPAPPSQVTPPKPAPREASFKITDSFTAQRRPRVTVLTFEDTNKTAQKAKYGPAVEAMLVTFLKRKSQFVVVERQKINSILSEKQRLQMGEVQADASDQAALALLEKIDVFILGSVTLVDLPNQPQDKDSANAQESANAERPMPELQEKEDGDDDETQAQYSDGEEESEEESGMLQRISIASLSQPEEKRETKSSGEKWENLGGPRIEIDVKLISRFDGRIIAAAQRSGPVACLRSIIERLGVALEQEFLRPYYGTLTVTLNEPEHVRLFLTPILPADALDEEKPPIERSTTVTIGGERDTVEPWTTDPTTYTIKTLLSGWYSMRIERPGYTEINLENARWEVRKRQGKDVVYDKVTKLPWDKDPLSLSRFVVQVTPLTSDVLDLKSLQFTFNKEGGSFTPLVKRQYLDTAYSRGPQRVILAGGPKIDLNRIDGPGEYADDPRCDLFVEETPNLSNYGRTYVTTGQEFHFDQFTGGELIIEDYKGEVVPVGRYSMVLWEPSYQLEHTPVTVRNNDKSSIKVSLIRETATLQLGATGARPSSHARLVGQETRYSRGLPLDFSKLKEIPGVPVDTYAASTDIKELAHWSHGVEIPATNLTAPIYDTASKKNEPQILQAALRPEEKVTPFVGVKTRFGLAGHLRVLSRKPDPLAADLFIDQDVAKILNLLLYGVETRPADKEDRPSLEEAAAQAGRGAQTQTTTTVEVKAPGGVSTAVRQERKVTPPGQPATQQEADNAAQKDKPAAPKPDPFPKDPDALRKLLAEHLEVIDLLVLDPVDMAQLRQSADVAGVLTRWVAAGGSLFAFVSSPGDYRDVVGAPLTIETMSKRTKRFDLTPGKVPGLVQVTKKKVKSKARRRLPELTNLDNTWRVLAYTKAGKGPRIIERGAKGQGGSVILWFDDPESFRGFWGGTRPEVEQTRANVEGHVLKTARDLMRSRFGEGASAPVSRTRSSKP